MRAIGNPLYVNGTLVQAPVTISHVPGPQQGILAGFGIDPSMGAYAAYRPTGGMGEDPSTTTALAPVDANTGTPVAPTVALPAPATTPAAAPEPVATASGLGPMGWAYVVGDIAITSAMAYHGYKRNNSLGWALVWALLGGAVPIIGVPVALAQGFAKPKSMTPNRRRRRR